MFKKIATAAALLIVSSAAFAGQPDSFYAGVDAGATRASNAWDGSKTSYGVFAGYKLNESFAVEAGYRRLAKHKAYNARGTVDQTAVSLVASMPVGESFSVFGRAGVSVTDEEVRYTGGRYDNSPTRAVIGVGAGYAFTPKIKGRVEFQKTGSDIRNLSAGVSYQF
ncbi:MAG: porin family protein [Pseudomonadota bacterium]